MEQSDGSPMKRGIATMASMFLMIISTVAGGAAMATSNIYPPKVIEAIKIALDDEYRAAAFYEGVIAKFGDVRPFINIVEAERRHARRLEQLLTAAGAEVPANPYSSGEKAPPAVPASLREACQIGVDAEIENAALYDARLLPLVEGYADVTAAMLDLRAASQDKHLPAFLRCVERGGGGRGGRGKIDG